MVFVIVRLFEFEFDKLVIYKFILRKKVLGIGFLVSEFSSLSINVYYDFFFRSMVYWILEDYSVVLEILIK